MSNEIAFCTLSMIHPVTYAVANTLKRSIVVASSLVSQPTPAAGGRGWGRGRELGPARRPLRAESLPHARASFACAPRCSFSRVYPLLDMPAPSWRLPALSYTRCTPSLRDRGLSVPTPSPFSPASSFCCRCSVSAGRFTRDATIRLTRDRTAFTYSAGHAGAGRASGSACGVEALTQAPWARPRERARRLCGARPRETEREVKEARTVQGCHRIV